MEPPSPLPAALVLWRQQDEPQTETPKDFWTLAQWADSVRRWLASPSRPPPGLRPPLPTPALANKLPALASWDPTDRGCGLGKETGVVTGVVLVSGVLGCTYNIKVPSRRREAETGVFSFPSLVTSSLLLSQPTIR